jgi:hypothetical protein
LLSEAAGFASDAAFASSCARAAEGIITETIAKKNKTKRYFNKERDRTEFMIQHFTYISNRPVLSGKYFDILIP